MEDQNSLSIGISLDFTSLLDKVTGDHNFGKLTDFLFKNKVSNNPKS